MKILHLTLHRKWFDAIATGAKKEEYRSTSKYWQARLLNEEGPVIREFDEIHFRNGYAKNAPWMRVEWKGMKDGVFLDQDVFAIQLGAILEIKNWSGPLIPGAT